MQYDSIDLMFWLISLRRLRRNQTLLYVPNSNAHLLQLLTANPPAAHHQSD